MNIKIWNFNFVSDNAGSLTLDGYDFSTRFDRFYMDGKEDTLYVGDMWRFENADKYNHRFEQELSKKYYILDYHLLIKNKINAFIKEKTMKLYMDNNYSRYDLYNNIDFYDLTNLKNNNEIDMRYTEKITCDNKIVYEINNGYKLVFDPYSEEIENIEELYNAKYFDKFIKNNLILMEIQNKKAPDFVLHLIEINEFLNGKMTVNVLFNDGSKEKVEASVGSILRIRGNNTELSYRLDDNHKLEELKKITYNKKELDIDINKLMNLKEQIKKTPADMLRFKVDEMRDSLYNKFNEFKKNNEFYYYSDLKSCIDKIKEIDKRNSLLEEKVSEDNKESYPEWYTEEFKQLWDEYDLINSLSKAQNIDEIKHVASETGDNELKKICSLLENTQNEYEDEEEMSL